VGEVSVASGKQQNGGSDRVRTRGRGARCGCLAMIWMKCVRSSDSTNSDPHIANSTYISL
jgi:hypothetical protein